MVQASLLIGLVTMQCHLDHGLELAVLKRLEHVAVWVGHSRAFECLAIGIRGQIDDRDVVLVPDHLRGFDAVHPTAELDVHEHELEPHLRRSSRVPTRRRRQRWRGDLAARDQAGCRARQGAHPRRREFARRAVVPLATARSTVRLFESRPVAWLFRCTPRNQPRKNVVRAWGAHVLFASAPCRAASRIISMIECVESFFMIRCRWVSTVRRAMNSFVAMSSFVAPRISSSNTSRSRRVSHCSGRSMSWFTCAMTTCAGADGGR